MAFAITKLWTGFQLRRLRRGMQSLLILLFAVACAGLAQKPQTLFVAKGDDSKQCGMGAEISLEEMQKQLGSMKIYSMKKIHDGLIRVTLCGAPTGMLNRYEIDKSDLETAKSLGFKLWESKTTH